MAPFLWENPRGTRTMPSIPLSGSPAQDPDSEPYQLELPYTKVPNVFLDEWVNFLGLVEIRIVAAIIRRSFGWHRRQTGRLSVTELCKITRRSRPMVVNALGRLRGYGIVTASRISRQEAHTYGLIMRPEFEKIKEAPPPELQTVLPYDVLEFPPVENSDYTISVVKKTLPLSGKENLTTDAPVLICIKERDPKERKPTGAQKARAVENSKDSEAVQAYRAQFGLNCSRGRKADIDATVTDLSLWRRVLASWGYQSGDKWIRFNPLNIGHMLSEYERLERKAASV
jgi:hypothetical protein